MAKQWTANLLGLALSIMSLASPPAEAASTQRRSICLSRLEGLRNGCARYTPADKNCQSGGNRLFGFVQDSCMNDPTAGIRTDILALPDKARPPGIEKGINGIARSLVYRLFKNTELSRISDEDFANPLNLYYADTEIHLAFSPTYIEKIAQAGFLNFHQVHDSGGCAVCGPDRLQVESVISHLDLNRLSTDELAILPKYAYVIPIFDSPGIGPSNYHPSYGSVIAVMNDWIKQRATFFLGDTLNRKDDLIKSNRIPHTFYDLSATRDAANSSADSYIEAQIWGDLHFQDVRYFLVNCPGLNAVDNERIATLAKLSERPVYSCVKKRPSSSSIYEPGSLLAGNDSHAEIPYSIGSISILSAAYEAPSGKAVNATDSAQKHCDGKTSCDYLVSPKHLGLIAESTDGTRGRFEIHWKCTSPPWLTGGAREAAYVIPHEALGSKFRIDCSTPGAAATPLPKK